MVSLILGEEEYSFASVEVAFHPFKEEEVIIELQPWQAQMKLNFELVPLILIYEQLPLAVQS